MQKNGFTIIEVVVVFLLILGVTFLILPKSLETTKQARFISKWSQKYSELEYMFSVIMAQKEGQVEKRFLNAKNNCLRKDIMLEAIKPYLRISSKVKGDYNQFFMDGTHADLDSRYYFDDFYYMNADEIVGLKLIMSNCKNGGVCASMSFDINGVEPPNTWGYDIFGVDVLRDRIEPFGKDIEPDILKQNCSKHGTGVYCSYYYLIGGRFD